MSNDLLHERYSEGRAGWRLVWPVCLALLGFACLPLDLPIAQWFQDERCPGEILRWLSFAETYAYGFGVFCILLTVFALDPARRHLLPRGAAIAFGGGLLANGMKLMLARARPHDFFKSVSDLAAASGASVHVRPASVLDTFGQWLPVGRVASGFQGFPSGHMATAFGLTAVLLWLYPHGRWIFPLFAVLAGCQRMSSKAHFLSDVAWGAAAGCLIAMLFLPGGLLAGQFDRLECWLQSRKRKAAETPANVKPPAVVPRRRDAA